MDHQIHVTFKMNGPRSPSINHWAKIVCLKMVFWIFHLIGSRPFLTKKSAIRYFTLPYHKCFINYLLENERSRCIDTSRLQRRYLCYCKNKVPLQSFPSCSNYLTEKKFATTLTCWNSWRNSINGKHPLPLGVVHKLCGHNFGHFDPLPPPFFVDH